MPTPMPAKNREEIKRARFGETAIAREDIQNIDAANNNPGFRPYLSAILPAIIQPIMHPTAF